MEWTKEQLQFRMVDTLQDGDWWCFKGLPHEHTRFQCICPEHGEFFSDHKIGKCRCGKKLVDVEKWSQRERFALNDDLRPRIVAFDGLPYIFIKVHSDTLYDKARAYGLKALEPIDLWTYKKEGRKMRRDKKVPETPEERTIRVFQTMMDNPEGK